MLGYHDTLDFPNNLETWERGIHPRDLEEVSRTFQEAFQDKTNEKKYDVEYRMRMADGTYQWFKDKGEVSCRADGTAFRMAGIFINIDAEKKQLTLLRRVMKKKTIILPLSLTGKCREWTDWRRPGRSGK